MGRKAASSEARQRRRAPPRCALLALLVAAGALPPAFAPLPRETSPLNPERLAAEQSHASGQPPAPATPAAVGRAAPWHAGLAAFACATLVALAAPLQLPIPALAEEMLNAEEQQTVANFDLNTPGVVFITGEVFRLEDAARMEVEKVPQGSGSGWVYDKEGHIVTNFHVIKDSNTLTVKFIEGTELPAKVVGADPGSDVAVLQVDLPPGRANKLLRPLSVGPSAPLRVGQEVYAIGNPFGLDHTLTKGIVSGVGRTITSVSGRPIQGAIQTDASINPGNSGGPLINSRGKVIGMNTVILSPSGASAGVGFAIPSDTVSARVASIIRYGYVKRPSLGIYLGQDGLAERLSGRKDGGSVVAGVQRGAAGNRAGIRTGDILLQIDERRVKRVNDVFAELDEHQPGEQVTVKLLRPDNPEIAAEMPEGGIPYREVTLSVTLAEAPAER